MGSSFVFCTCSCSSSMFINIISSSSVMAFFAHSLSFVIASFLISLVCSFSSNPLKYIFLHLICLFWSINCSLHSLQNHLSPDLIVSFVSVTQSCCPTLHITQVFFGLFPLPTIYHLPQSSQCFVILFLIAAMRISASSPISVSLISSSEFITYFIATLYIGMLSLPYPLWSNICFFINSTSFSNIALKHSISFPTP